MSLLPLRVKQHADQAPASLFSTLLSGSGVAQITYGTLYASSCAYAQEYKRQGVAPGDIVLIILRHSPHLFYSFLGATLAGAIPSFMPFPSPKQRSDLYCADLEALCSRLEPRLIVSYAENAVTLAPLAARRSVRLLIADDALLERHERTQAVYPGLQAAADDVLCLQHSSGTTGLKKGVMLTHAAVLGHIATYCSALKFSGSDSIVSWLPLYHDMGFIACFMLSIVNGTHLIALDPFEWSARPKLLLDAIETYRPTLCWLPNFAYTHLTRAVKNGCVFDLTSIRAFINCSEPCKETTFKRFIERFSPSGVENSQLAVCYAMAENVFAVTQTALGDVVPTLCVDADALSRGLVEMPQAGSAVQSLVSCGLPIGGVELRICDTAGNDCSAGEVGEILIATDSLFVGYYKQPEITRKRLQGGWYATRDMGFLHDGQLYITGRVDDMIIVNGRNYYAHELEALLSAVREISPGRVAVVDVFDTDSDANVIVVLAEAQDATVDPSNLARAARSTLAESLGLAIHRVVPLATGTLLKTTSGKMDRVRNRQLYLQHYERRTVGV